MNFIFDIEANGFLESVTSIHSLVIRDADTGELIKSCADQPGYTQISEGLDLLGKASKLVGHNIDGYDLPVLSKLKDFVFNGEVEDTLVLSRLAYPNLFEREIGKSKEELGYKPGSQSLEAWGKRLGEEKIKFGNEEDEVEKTFEVWTPEMQVYCEQDTKVNYVLYQKLISKQLSVQASEIEHKFNRIIQQQMLNGIQFDVEKAKALSEELKKDILKIEKWVHENIQPRIIKLKTKDKVVPFNIGSTDQVADYFITKYGWNPPLLTKTKKPSITGDLLGSLKFPEAKIFKDYNDRIKIQGFLVDGKNAWLKAVKDTGRIHGYINPNGQITGRISMSKPNMGQIPSKGVYKGEECRALFISRQGYSLVDCDASGIQLRMLGHYLHRYDNGAYAKEIIEGDVHTKNQIAAGLKTRPQAKEWIYAFLFGAGLEELGFIYDPELSSEEKKLIGKRLKTKFLEANPEINDLLWDCKRAYVNRGYITSLDGRKLYPRGDYKTINTLLQGGEAVVMKLANIIATEDLLKSKIDFYQVAYIHDQYLFEVKEGQEEEAGLILRNAIIKSGEKLNLKIKLDGEYKIGKSWDKTH